MLIRVTASGSVLPGNSSPPPPLSKPHLGVMCSGPQAEQHHHHHTSCPFLHLPSPLLALALPGLPCQRASPLIKVSASGSLPLCSGCGNCQGCLPLPFHLRTVALGSGPGFCMQPSSAHGRRQSVAGASEAGGGIKRWRQDTEENVKGQERTSISLRPRAGVAKGWPACKALAELMNRCNIASILTLHMLKHHRITTHWLRSAQTRHWMRQPKHVPPLW